MRIPVPLVASFVLAALLTVLTLVFRNHEFLIYAITVLVLVAVLYKTDRHFRFSRLGLWLFNGWLVMHSLGGLASYQGVRFYDLMLLDLVGDPYHVLKYDQFVHFYCYVAISVLMWSVVRKIAKPNANGLSLCVINVLAASSLGAVNEIVEFLAVILLGSEGVGGYTNTAIDLVANLLGAIVGTVYMYARQEPAPVKYDG